MKKNYFIFTLLLFLGVYSFAQPCSELFISEYVEGSSNNKYIEIYNPTSAAVTLTSNYDLQIYFNGSATAGSTIALTGVISANGVFVIENSSESLGVAADQQSGALTFNGNDAIVLRNGTTNIDIIGQIGFDPGSQWTGSVCTEGTGEGTLVRNASVQSGDTNGADAFDPDTEWTCFAQDTVINLGSHSSSCVASSEIQIQLPVSTDVACGFTYDFGTQTLGTSTDVVFRILNSGSADLDVTNITFTSGIDFAQVAPPPLPFTLTPGNFQDITVRFSPTSLGSFSDTITITNTDGDESTCAINFQGTSTSSCGTTTTIIAAQDFESVASDTWNYTPVHAPITNFWYVTNSLTNIATAQSATNFWGMTDLERAGHTGLTHEITFDVVDVSAFNNVELSFYYYTINVDSSDDLTYEVFYDGSSQGVVDISANTAAWTQVLISIPDAVNTVQIMFSADLDAANDQAGLDNFTISSTSINTTTWDGTTWNPVTPDNMYTAIINAPYNTSTNGSFEACRLIVNEVDPSSELIISDGEYVRIVNDILLDGQIAVSHEGSLVQINDAANVTLNGAGTGIVQKTTNVQELYSYTYWSSPFVNETLGETASGIDLVPTNRIFEYNASNFEDTDADGFDDNTNDWSIASGAMIPGRGYAAFAQDNGMMFPQTQTYSFDGEFNNGVITIAAQVSADAGDPNWNLLGNPYPSGINADLLITGNPDLDGTIYLWTHNSDPNNVNPGPDELNFSVDDYASYTPGSGGVAAVTGGTAPTGIIASGQGFFVEALNAGTVTFNNGLRVIAGNDDFFRAIDRIWLNFENELGAFSQILVAFSEEATNGFDRLYDGKRLDAGSYISFFTMIDDENYAIQGREALTEEEIIPLGYKNLVEGDSEYTISIDHVEGLLENSEVYLMDNVLNIKHDLNQGEYRFVSEQGEFKERFELELKSTLPIDIPEEELVIIKNEDDTLSFLTADSTITNIQIFDTIGRLLYDIDVKEGDSNFKLEALNNTIFVVRASLSNGKVLSKKALK